jgi:hypothetical protein
MSSSGSHCRPGGKASIQGPRPDWAKFYPASSCPEVSLLSENPTKDGHTAELGPSSRQMLQSRALVCL